MRGAGTGVISTAGLFGTTGIMLGAIGAIGAGSISMRTSWGFALGTTGVVGVVGVVAGIVLPGFWMGPPAFFGAAGELIPPSQQLSRRWKMPRSLPRIFRPPFAHGSLQVGAQVWGRWVGCQLIKRLRPQSSQLFLKNETWACDGWHVAGWHVSQASRLNRPFSLFRRRWPKPSQPHGSELPQFGPQAAATAGVGAAAGGAAFFSAAWPTNIADVINRNTAFTRNPPNNGNSSGPGSASLVV